MRIVFDENLSPRFAEILSLCYKNVDATSVKRMGMTGSKDITLLETLASQRPLPVFVGSDVNITRRGDERKALRESQVNYILFDSNLFDMKFPEQAWRLIKLWPDIIARVNEKDQPTVMLVNLANGRMGPL